MTRHEVIEELTVAYGQHRENAEWAVLRLSLREWHALTEAYDSVSRVAAEIFCMSKCWGDWYAAPF